MAAISRRLVFLTVVDRHTALTVASAIEVGGRHNYRSCTRTRSSSAVSINVCVPPPRLTGHTWQTSGINFAKKLKRSLVPACCFQVWKAKTFLSFGGQFGGCLGSSPPCRERIQWIPCGQEPHSAPECTQLYGLPWSVRADRVRQRNY